MINNLKNRKKCYVGHIKRNKFGHYDTRLRTIEGRREGIRGRGRPRRTWDDDLRDWTGSKRYDQIKIAAEKTRNNELMKKNPNVISYNRNMLETLVPDLYTGIEMIEYVVVLQRSMAIVIEIHANLK